MAIHTALAPKQDTPQTARRATLWFAPLVSALLLYLCFFPVAMGWLAWIALIPWLCLVRLPGRPRRLYLSTYLGALAFYAPVLQWARVADLRMYITWITLSLYCSFYVTIGLALLRRLDRRTSWPLVVTFPVVWVSMEFIRWGMYGSFYSLFTGSYRHDYPGGFSWYFLGHSQHDFLEIIQIADIGGVYSVSFVVAGVNALLFEMLYARDWFRRLLGEQVDPRPGKLAILVQGVAIAGVLFAVLGYGVYRLGQQTMQSGPRLALMQSNVDQRLRNTAYGRDEEARMKARKEVAATFGNLARAGAARQVDLLVSAETSFPGVWEEVAPGRPSGWSREQAKRMSSDLNTAILLGMSSVIGEEDRTMVSYNSAILLGSDGAWLGRYDKIHRVPFGEYIPLRTLLPFLGLLAPYDFDYSVAAGDEFTRFPLTTDQGNFTFGVVICYEDTDTAMARPYVQGEKIDFLLNISNDGWFDGTAEHDQHLAICRFRAVETRRSVGRAVNMGISAFIDSNGRVLAPRRIGEDRVPGSQPGTIAVIPIWELPNEPASLPVSSWHEHKKVAGVIIGRIPIDSRNSWYAWGGDLFAMGCSAVLVVGLFLSWIRKEAST